MIVVVGLLVLPLLWLGLLLYLFLLYFLWCYRVIIITEGDD